MHVELFVTAGPAKGKRFNFDTSDCFLFGRAKDAHISLPNDLYVSRQHFFLEISPPDCKLRDLNSKNGVLVNGIRYGGRTPLTKGTKQAPINEVYLRDKDEIMVGETHIRVSIQAEVPSRVIPPQQPGIRCILCGKDVSHEAVEQKHPVQTNYVCLSCRENIVVTPGTTPKKIFQQAPGKRGSSSTESSQKESAVIGRFRVEKAVGRGTMGTIYKAREDKTGRLVAIKTFRSETVVDPAKLKSLEPELHIIRHLKHKNIVQFFEYEIVNNRLYFIFEFVDGITLRKLMLSHKGGIPLKEAIPIFLGTLEGLAFAHRIKVTARTSKTASRVWKGTVHRDLSPQNILLVKKGERWIPKISDFKLSKSIETAGITNITSPKDMLGAPMYWPREQLTHYKYANPATDVFSVAAIFYEMLTGTWIRDGFQELFARCKRDGRLPSISDYMHVIATHPPVPIRKHNPNIPKPLAYAIDRALREQELPHDDIKVQEILRTLRYPDAGIFRDALIKALQESKIPVGLQESRKPQKISKPQIADINPLPGAIVHSTPQSSDSREVALLVLDVVHSTKYVLREGDTHFSKLIGKMLTRVKTHPASSSLLFLKGTGDGFLAAFHSLPATFSLALTFLETPIDSNVRVRMALHWGMIKTGLDGDMLGMEVLRISRIEGVKEKDRIDDVNAKRRIHVSLPEAERILITAAGLKQLNTSDQRRFVPAGMFQLPGFDEPCELWLFTKDPSLNTSRRDLRK